MILLYASTELCVPLVSQLRTATLSTLRFGGQGINSQPGRVSHLVEEAEMLILGSRRLSDDSTVGGFGSKVRFLAQPVSGFGQGPRGPSTWYSFTWQRSGPVFEPFHNKSAGPRGRKLLIIIAALMDVVRNSYPLAA